MYVQIVKSTTKYTSFIFTYLRVNSCNDIADITHIAGTLETYLIKSILIIQCHVSVLDMTIVINVQYDSIRDVKMNDKRK